MYKMRKMVYVAVFLFTLSFLVVQVLASTAVETEVWYHIQGKIPSPPPVQPVETVPWGISRINAISASAFVDESWVIVAILDTGMDMDHPDLAAQYVWGWDTVNNDNYPDDDHGHGTHVAGTVAAIDNEIGVIGVAPTVGLYILKVLNKRGSGTETQISNAIRMATNGPDGIPNTDDDADVISMSLGGSYSSTIEAAVNYALSYGVVVVAATGNDGASTPSYPAALPGVIKVGATDINNVEASWSNDGETILAPGVSIYSTYYGGGYTTMSGTSMATPHVSGVCALAIAAHPTYTMAQIRSLVEGSGDIYGVVNALAVV